MVYPAVFNRRVYKQNLCRQNCENRDSYGISYICYSTYSLIPIIMKIQFGPPSSFRHAKSPHPHEGLMQNHL